MSWTQGIQVREDLPEKFLLWADNRGKGELRYITWFEEDRNVIFLDYGERGSLKLTVKDKKNDS